MHIRIKRIDKELPLPEYKTPGAVAFDLSARVTTTVPAHRVAYVPLNVVIEPPEGFYLAMVARSSLHKRGLMSANGYAVFDADFTGNSDEYVAALYNFTDGDVTVERGDRIMQVVVTPYSRVEFTEVEDMGNVSRGGFGSTGSK